MRLAPLLLLLTTAIAGHGASSPTVVAADPGMVTPGTTVTIVIDGSGYVDVVATHRAGAVAFNGHEYLVVAGLTGWDQARQDCELRGGHLATIGSAAEQAAVRGLSGGELWIGLSEQGGGAGADWRWVTGEPLAYTAWIPGEPNNTFEAFALMADSPAGLWNNVSLNESAAYVCEFSDPPSVTLARSGHPDVTADRVRLVSSGRIIATMTLPVMAAGAWDVRVANADGGSATAVGLLAVEEVSGIARAASYGTPAGTTLSATLPAGDANGDPVTYTIVTPPTAGTLALTDAATGAFTFVPPPGVGTTSFTYELDSPPTTSTATCRIFWGGAPLPAGPLRAMLVLGPDASAGVHAHAMSGTSMLWDQAILSGLGPEWLQQPGPGLAVTMRSSSQSFPLTWTAASDVDGVWGGALADGYAAYSGLYLIVPSTRQATLAWSADDALKVWLDGASTPLVDGASGATAPFTLTQGVHRLIMKRFDGSGGDRQSLRIVDPGGADMTDLGYALTDIVPPIAAPSWPGAGDTNVPRWTDIQIEFSEPMDTSLAASAAASLTGGPADGTWSWGDRYRLCWTPAPSAQLTSATTYTATLAAGVRDANGNPVLGAASWSFTTADGVSTDAVLTGLSVGSGSRGSTVTDVRLYGGGFHGRGIAHPPGVTAYAGRYYRFVTTRRQWWDAQADCQAQGGHLATIANASEDAFVWELGGRINNWLGMNDLATYRSFAWVTGEPMAYARWGAGEPSDWGEERYGIYWWGFQWNDVPGGGDGRTYVAEFDRMRGPGVRLRRAGQPDIVAAATRWIDGTEIALDLDLTGAAGGMWDVVVENGDGGEAVLPGGFAILNTAPVAVDGAARVGPGGSATAVGASDANGDALTLSLTTPPSQGSVTFNHGAGSWTYTAGPSAAGSDSFAFTASDGADTSAPATVVIAIDTDTPVVTILGPTSGPSISLGSGFMQLVGTAVDDSGIAAVTWTATGAFVGGGSAVPGSAWATSLTLPVGVTHITVTAADGYGNSGSDSVSITVRPSAPIVYLSLPLLSGREVVLPATPEYFSGGCWSDVTAVATVTWEMIGATTATGAATMIGSTFVIHPPPMAAGATVLTVTATDGDGATGQASVRVIIDAEPPVLTVSAPLDGSVVAGSNVLVQGTASDNVGLALLHWALSGATYASSSGPLQPTWSLVTPALNPGLHQLVVRVVDRAGSEASRTITFTVDGTPAGIAITAPMPGLRTADSAIAVAGTAARADVVQIAWRLDGATSGSGTAVGTTSWSFTTPALAEGSTLITVTAHHPGGTTASTSRLVTVDRTAPIVAFAGVGAGATLADGATIAGTALDASGIVEVRWLMSGANAGAGVATGSGTWSFALGALVAGPTTLTVIAEDACGNRGSASIAVTGTGIAAGIRASTDPRWAGALNGSAGGGCGMGAGAALLATMALLARRRRR